MTFQEAMDAIFYGNIVDVNVQETASIGTSVPVTMTIRGNALITNAKLYQDDILIGEFEREHFLEWSHTVQSNPILKNTKFTFIVEYINGQQSTAECVCKVSYGIFVGAVPKACLPGDLRYSAMLEIAEQGLGEMFGYDEDVTEIKHKLNWSGDLRKITLAIPSEYNQLDFMYTASQHFGTDAFYIEEIPVSVPEIDEPILYTYYMYEQPLIAFNSEINFKLSNHE